MDHGVDWLVIGALAMLAFTIGFELGGRFVIYRYMTQGVQHINKIEERK